MPSLRPLNAPPPLSTRPSMPPTPHPQYRSSSMPPEGPHPVPSEDGFMDTGAKMSLADIALALRDEQLQAQVIHYRADLQTSPELDAITAQVIADLHMMQGAAVRARSAPPRVFDKAQIEIELIETLKRMLGRLFRNDKLASVVERKLTEISKRFARIFFESELHEKIRGGASETKTMRFAEQALFHVLSRNEARILEQLDSFEFSSLTVREQAEERFLDIIKALRNDFLGRTTPELNALVKFLNDVLRLFFLRELPGMVGALAYEVVKEARLAETGASAGYKLPASAFKDFRTVFERRFLQRLVPFSEDEMLKRVRNGEVKFRAETLRFVADPQIFTDVCELVCNAIYDFLYNDGFLDLPADWRAHLATS
jgi:hypothetical protein